MGAGRVSQVGREALRGPPANAGGPLALAETLTSPPEATPFAGSCAADGWPRASDDDEPR